MAKRQNAATAPFLRRSATKPVADTAHRRPLWHTLGEELGDGRGANCRLAAGVPENAQPDTPESGPPARDAADVGWVQIVYSCL